jgi:glycosyltransferase involved in cell wall biosynthesis
LESEQWTKSNLPTTDPHWLRPLFVFEPSITRASPSGSCLLKMLEALAGKWPIHIFANRCELGPAPLSQQTHVPLSPPVELIRRILFPMFTTLLYLPYSRSQSIRIATEAAFPLCQISHTQFCHRYFLRHHRDAIATTWARRVARTLTHRWLAFLERIAFGYAKKIVVPSEGAAHELESTYPSLTRGKICVIPNPVDTKHFQRNPTFNAQAVHHQLGIVNPALVLCFCALGGFTRKGLPIILAALADSYNPAIHLIVVGGRPGEIREFASIAKRLNIDHSVHFVGLQSDIRPYLWSSDVFILPSAYETFSLACFQAAAAGLPLISSRINGVEDFLVPGINGWLVERSTESVAAAIREAAASPEKTALLGRTAQSQVQAYGAEAFQSRWLKLLDREFGIHCGV